MNDQVTSTSEFSRVGMKIQHRLIELDRNQSWLADKVGVTPQQVSKWMRASYLQPTTQTKLCKALDVPASFWL